MRIRKYINSDKKDVLELFKLNTPEFFSPSEESDLNFYLDNHSEYYYVLEIENRICACAGYNIFTDNLVRISWDIVHPKKQSKGLGTELIKFRLQKIREIEGVKLVSVRTTQLVYKFYEKFGFELKETLKDFWAAGFDLYKMECDLKLLKM